MNGMLSQSGRAVALLGARLPGLALMAQPLLPLIVLISVLGGPLPFPLWVSWAIALAPLPVRLWRTGRLFEATPFDIPIPLFLVGMGIGLAVSVDRPLGSVAMQTYIACMLFFYGLTSNANLGPRYWWSVGAAITLGVLGFSVMTFSQGNNFYGSGGSKVVPINRWLIDLLEPLPEFGGWLGNIPLHNNTLGLALGIGLPALVAIVIFGKGHFRIAAGVLGSLFSAILFLSLSGVGWVAALVGLVFIGCCALRKRAYALLPVLPVLGGLAYLAWNNVDWLNHMFPWSAVTSRVRIWETGLTMIIMDHPWFGVGPGQYVLSGPPQSPHNAYLLLYADAGLLGILALIGAAGVTLGLGRQVMRFTRVRAPSRTNPWHAVGVGTLAALAAGAAVSMLESSTAKTWIDTGGNARYVAMPGVWFWAAMLVVAHRHLYPSRSSEKELRR